MRRFSGTVRLPWLKGTMWSSCSVTRGPVGGLDRVAQRHGRSGWGGARLQAKVAGAKLHAIYAADADRPIYAAVSAARVNDIAAAHAMPIVPGATYVFDLGYYDYAWRARLDAAQCRVVTRFKVNTPLEAARDLTLPQQGGILSDRIGFLPARQAASRRNPMRAAVRGPLAFARLVRANLFHKRRIDRLLEPDPLPIQPHRQMLLQWT